MIAITPLNHPETDHRYTDELYRLDQMMRQQQSAPYLYPKERSFYQHCLSGNCYNVLACHGNEVIGYAALRPMSPWPAYLNPVDYPEKACAMMLHNMVSPQWRGQGIAKRLNQARLKIAQQQEFRYLFSTVHPDNTPSIRSLERMGFQVIEQRPMFSEQLLRNLMFLELPQPA